MQIHEVFEPSRATAGAMLKDPKSFINPTRFTQPQQAGYDASAAKSAEKLRRQGYGQPVTAPNVNQLISQVQADSAAQQLINTWAAQWPEQAAKIPLANSQQQVTEQPNSPDPAYRAAFVNWANNVVEKTVRMPNVVSKMTDNSEWAAQFDAALDQVENTISDTQRHNQAVQAYLTLAVAAARANNQDSAPAIRSCVASGLNDPQANALATVLELDEAGIAKLNAYMKKNNEQINPNGTGSPSLDALLRAAKLLK